MALLLRKAFGFVFDNPYGKVTAAVAGLMALVAAFAWDQRSIGARDAIAKREKVNATEIKKANDAGKRSRDPAVPGVLDPYTRAGD